VNRFPLLSHLRVAVLGLFIGASFVAADSYTSASSRAVFPSLSDSGTAVTSTVPLVVPLGAIATPSIAFTGDTDQGFYSPSNNVMRIVSNGSERFQFVPGSMNILGATGFLGFAPSNIASPDASWGRIATGVTGTTGSIALGTNPASAGAVRLANTATISARNAANDGNVTIATVNASDQPVFGAGVTQTCDAAGDITVVGGIITACTAP
jgi:hypothetical protein